MDIGAPYTQQKEHSMSTQTRTGFHTNEKGNVVRRIVVYRRDSVKELQYQMIDGKWLLCNWQTRFTYFESQ